MFSLAEQPLDQTGISAQSVSADCFTNGYSSPREYWDEGSQYRRK